MKSRFLAIGRAVPRTRWAALILVTAAWAIYFPALNRVFATDQIWYFAELDGDNSLTNGLRHYDYAATRRYWKGDEALFRPLLFVWLAVGTRLFSYHYVWWNIANVSLHALVATALFQLLVTIRPTPFALPAALLFVGAITSIELVLWNHLGGYLFACLFLLIGLRGFVRLMRHSEGTGVGPDAATFALAFTAAGLFYEATIPISLLAGVVVLWTHWRQGRRPTAERILTLVSPAVVFFLLYVFHMLRVERLSYVDRPDVAGIFDLRNVAAVLPRSLDVIGRWAVNLAFPAALRFDAAPFTRLTRHFAFSWDSPLHVLNGAVVAVALLVLPLALSRRHLKNVLPLLVVLAGGLVAYTSVICLGRPQKEVVVITYYLYMFGLLLGVLAYTLIDFDQIQTWKRGAFGGLTAVMIMLHAAGAAGVARQIGRANEAPGRYLTHVASFVDAHRAEADFTFAVEAVPRRLDPQVVLLEGYPDDPNARRHVRRLTDILFKPYYNERNPKYMLDYR